MTSTKPHGIPVAEQDRIITLDTIRGFALLGILVMNIQSYAMPGSAYFFPHSFGDMTGLNHLVWLLGHLLTDMKFIALFSMLFGAGICLMTDRAQARGARVAVLHYRRMFMLWVIGMLHAHLLWYGDILVTYAACGMMIFPLRRLRPRWLILIAVVLLTIGVALALLSGLTADQWPEESRQQLLDDMAPTAEQITEEIAIHHHGGKDLLLHTVEESIGMQTFIFWYWSIWRDAAAMLLGMAFFKMGMLSGLRSRRFYTTLAIVMLVIGWTLVVLGWRRHEAHEWDVFQSFFISSNFNTIGAPLVAIGYLSLVSLACLARWSLGALAAVGRMALTNYLSHTVICFMLFNGPFLASFGEVSRVGQAGIVVAIWVIQLTVSPWWMKRFHFGPAEWMWRSMTYGRRQRFRRSISSR